jgi:putative PIN family toxin of toxin-antitoxin system
MADRLKIVLDTSVLIAALRSRSSASAEVVLRLLRFEIRMVLSLALLYEYRDVAMRSDQIAASQLPVAEIADLIDQLEEVAEQTLSNDQRRPLSNDPNDDLVLEAAINGSVDRLITHNIKHLREPASRFKIVVMTPREFLESLRLRE